MKLSYIGLQCLAVTLAISLLAGCAGRSTKPVAAQQVDDAFRSCTAIEQEMHFIENEINRLIPKTEQAGKNVGLGVAGMFFFPAWFFMDHCNRCSRCSNSSCNFSSSY